MLGYIHTHSCYFFFPSLPVNSNNLIVEDGADVDTILHLMDNIEYKVGDYKDLTDIPINYSSNDVVLYRLMQLLGEDEYKLMLNHALDVSYNPQVHDNLWYHASKYYKLELKAYCHYPHLAHCLPYSADDYVYDDYLDITDRSARWFLSHNTPNGIVNNKCIYLSIEVLEETLDFLNKIIDCFHSDLYSFISICKERGCNFDKPGALYQLVCLD